MILLIEDDEAIAYSIQTYFKRRDREILWVSNLKDAHKALQNKPEILLLDVELPDGNGFDFLKVNLSDIYCPVLFLTVKDSEEAIIKGLSLGADDYLTKPFKLGVLEARMDAVLRRSQPIAPLNESAPYALDDANASLIINGLTIAFTTTEYELIKFFLKRSGQTLSRQLLLQELWDNEGHFVNDNTLTVTIKRLREKLPKSLKIVALRGLGYRLEFAHE